ncbi:helix-hairpin-helix domain-containing protein [Rhodopseudomonas palustris]|uniref:helix-hairpin-helix domain-containing protein n=1 Tax=Rhodopseudomonas palustris TaxID=1076 RepID=UPI0009BBF1DF|nr:kinase [Rhodopseudomonas palustris]
MNVQKLLASNGNTYEVSFAEAKHGGMKDVYFTTDGSHVVAFYRKKLDPAGRDRVEQIVSNYRTRILSQEGGEYWKSIFCWPAGTVESGGMLGIVVPAYERHFYFEYGSRDGDKLGIRGREKVGKWFASASHRNRFLDAREKGDWLSYFRICILLSRGVRRLHAAGLAHSDLSYNNVLVDPTSGRICIIDIDGLVVPGKYPPDVVGTPDFIAPEVVATNHLARNDPARKLPSNMTDRHALAVLIYIYLFYRHPLRGGKIHDLDPTRDETLSMGHNALFVEHPRDASNRIRLDTIKKSDLPWADTARLPYSLSGPHLAPLFEGAFIEGLHDPGKRPNANSWEEGLIKTVDLLLPCRSPNCETGWFVYPETTADCCPFCGTRIDRSVPVLHLYSKRSANSNYVADNHSIVVYDGLSLFRWHIDRNTFPNERLSVEDRRRVGYFQFHQSKWYFVNERSSSLCDVTGDKRQIPQGSPLELKPGTKIQSETDDRGRLLVVEFPSK